MTTQQSQSVAFPEGFIWGAATAAYQVEGAAHLDGRKDSIWDTFARIPGAVVNADNGDVACDQYHRYADDAALMKSMNIGAYRFSTSWARVRPDGVGGKTGINRKGLDYYSRLVDSLLENDIMPWLTLYHWDLPQALEDKGGWANRDTAYLFAEFATTMHDSLGDRVNTRTTLNEPWCSSFLSYTAGVHAPGRKSVADGLAAGHHLLLGHGLAINELRAAAPTAELGITLNFTVADPLDPANPEDVDAARRIDSQFNRFFADPIFTGAYPLDLLTDLDEVGERTGFEALVKDGDLDIIGTRIDSLGVNYYHGEAYSTTPPAQSLDGSAPVPLETRSPYPAADGVYAHPRGLPVTDQNWEIQPEGLTRLLKRLHRDYTADKGVKLYITENGCAFDDVPDPGGFVDDQNRLDFYDVHLRATHDAIADGVPVYGYFAWSLLDNYEWAWGYTKRFGIVRVDYETQERVIKASGQWYAKIAETNVVPPR